MSEIKNFDRMFRLDGKVALVTGGKLYNRYWHGALLIMVR